MVGLITMNLWNVKNLEPPPINSAKADIKEIDIKFLNNVLKDAVEFFNNQPYLYSEAAVLSRTIYRLKMKFRSSKDFKAMEKLNRALRAYLEVGISKVLKTFLDSVPHVYKAHKTYLPTKHMLDFVLVRMQGLGKISIRILETCKVVCQLCQQRLGLGHFWNIALITYGMAARIFVIVKTVTKYTCELYSNLVPYSAKLRNCGKQWLPDGYVLPKNLSDWLEIDWVDLESNVIEIIDEKSEPDMFFFNLIEDSDDDVEVCDEYILVKDEPSSYRIKKPVKEETVELSDNHEDIGEVINLSEVETPQISNEENLGTRNGAFAGFDSNVDIGEVINLSDVETPQVSNKENLGTRNGTLAGFDSVDIGEVIYLSPKTPELALEKSRKRKRGKKLQFETPSEVINLSNIKTSQLKPTKRKKTKLSFKTTSSSDVIEIIDSPQPKITGKKKLEVIEIVDNSFNAEVIDLSDIETPKAPLKKGKKRKRGNNFDSELVESSFKVASLNPSKKRKKMKARDGKKFTQLDQNVKKSKMKKKLGFGTHSKVRGGIGLTKSKNIAPKASILVNAKRGFKKKKSTLINTSEKKKHKKKNKKRP